MEQCKMVKFDDVSLEDWQRDIITEVQDWMGKYKIKRYVIKEYGILQDGDCCCIHVIKLEDEGPDIIDNDDPQHAIALYDVSKLEEIASRFEDEGNPKGTTIAYFGDLWMFLTGYC